MSLGWKIAVRAEGFVSQKDEDEAREYALFKFALAGHRVQESHLRFPDVPVFEPGWTTNQWHFVHLGSRADGAASVVLVEATAVLQKGESRGRYWHLVGRSFALFSTHHVFHQVTGRAVSALLEDFLECHPVEKSLLNSGLINTPECADNTGLDYAPLLRTGI